MKHVKSVFTLTVAVLIWAAAIIYFDSKMLDHISQTAKQDFGTEADSYLNGMDMTDEKPEYAGADREDAQEDVYAGAGNDIDILKSYEDVPVSCNTAEYDIKVRLCENNNHRTYIRLEYYRDGITVINELDEEQIPELKASQHSIGQALLNPVWGQLYLLINGDPVGEFFKSSFYMADLTDMSLERIFSYTARCGPMSFNSDCSMLAYSISAPADTDVYRENEFIEIFDCKNVRYLVKESRKPDGTPIGPDSNQEFTFYYIFEGWNSSDIVKLSRVSPAEDNTGLLPIRTSVYYNIITDLLYDADGNIINAYKDTGMNGTPDDGGSGIADGNAYNGYGQSDADNAGITKSAEYEPVRLLMEFYSCLGSKSRYPEAMRMLDTDFVLRLGMLRQFGIDRIQKRDIDAYYNESNINMFADLLRTAAFDQLVSIQTVDADNVVIKYYQILELSAGTQTRMMMTARMVKKQDSGWRILLIEDGNQ